jgi:nucleotide-binding universal stress UspA family protein
VVPPECERTLDPLRELRILVPLDGSRLAEQAVPVALRLVDTFGGLLILLRATRHDENDINDADKYLHCIRAQLKVVLAEGEIITQVTSEEPAEAILAAARHFDVDGIVMSTRGRAGLARAVSGSTATTTLERANVPLILVGPGALHEATTAQIAGASGRTPE